MPHQQRLAALLCTTALLACGALAARADAAPAEPGTVGPPPPVLVAPTDPFSVTMPSPTTARMVGTGADAGLAADVQVTGGTLDGTAEFWAELWAWFKRALGLGSSSSTCTIFQKTVL